MSLQNASPIMPDKWVYLTTISIPLPSTEIPVIYPTESPVTIKLTDLSSDYQGTLQNSSKLTYASTDDLHVEMMALKSFVV